MCTVLLNKIKYEYYILNPFFKECTQYYTSFKIDLTSKQSSFADTGSAVINLNVTDKDKA